MPISSSLYNWKIFPLLPNLCCCKHVSWAFLKLCAHLQKYHYHACLEVKSLDLIICIALIFLCITKFFSQVFSQFIFPWKNSLFHALPNKIYDHILILLTKWVWNTKIFYVFLKIVIDVSYVLVICISQSWILSSQIFPFLN